MGIQACGCLNTGAQRVPAHTPHTAQVQVYKQVHTHACAPRSTAMRQFWQARVYECLCRRPPPAPAFLPACTQAGDLLENARPDEFPISFDAVVTVPSMEVRTASIEVRPQAAATRMCIVPACLRCSMSGRPSRIIGRPRPMCTHCARMRTTAVKPGMACGEVRLWGGWLSVGVGVGVGACQGPAPPPQKLQSPVCIGWDARAPSRMAPSHMHDAQLPYMHDARLPAAS
jgi:hypothetical protein